MLQTLKKRSGFTMIELLVVATVMILLTMIGLVSYQTAMRKARNGKRHADLEMVRSALVLYRQDYAGYPTGNFDQVLTTLKNGEYISNDTITDPKNDASYKYNYTGGTCATYCQTFDLTGYEEPAGTVFHVRNP